MRLRCKGRQIPRVHGHPKRNITRFTNKLRPFFMVLRKTDAIGWTDNCQSAFEEIKHYLTQPPILSQPLAREQRPVYYISRAMVDAETRYSRLEQITLALRNPRLSMKGQVMADFVVESPQQPTRGTKLDKAE
ncbi:hypothetical protein AAG906_035133 [Vitis piasezkii]